MVNRTSFPVLTLHPFASPSTFTLRVVVEFSLFLLLSRGFFPCFFPRFSHSFDFRLHFLLLLLQVELVPIFSITCQGETELQWRHESMLVVLVVVALAVPTAVPLATSKLVTVSAKGKVS